MVQATTRVSDDQYEIFKQTTAAIGTTPAEALRMFIHAFNEKRGFPYEVTTSKSIIEPFATEDEAARFATSLAIGTLNAAR